MTSWIGAEIRKIQMAELIYLFTILGSLVIITGLTIMFILYITEMIQKLLGIDSSKDDQQDE